jgi:hypothetical protein
LVLALVLPLSINPLVAAPPDCDTNPGHPSCKEEGGGNDQFLVAIMEHSGVPVESPLYHPGDNPDCILAIGHNAKGHFDTVFRPVNEVPPCAWLVADSGLELIGIGFHVTRDKKSGDVVEVWLNGVSADGIWYFTEDMFDLDVAYVDESPDDFHDAEFIIHLHANQVKLMQCDGDPSKQSTVCDTGSSGFFDIHDMAYIPNP